MQTKGQQGAHGPHRSPLKQFHSINTSAQSYDYTIKLIKRKNSNFLFENWNGPLFAKAWVSFTQGCWNWPSACGKDENLKSLQTDRWTTCNHKNSVELKILIYSELRDSIYHKGTEKWRIPIPPLPLPMGYSKVLVQVSILSCQFHLNFPNRFSLEIKNMWQTKLTCIVQFGNWMRIRLLTIFNQVFSTNCNITIILLFPLKTKSKLKS